MRQVALVAMVAVGLIFAAAAVAQERESLELGDEAPAFTLTDQNGETVRLEDYEGRIVVLEWFSGRCPSVAYHHHPDRRTMSTLAERFAEDEVVWLAINSSRDEDVATNRETAEEWEISYPILDDAGGEVGRAYGARVTPHMFVIDAEGKLAYRGAIDDDPGRRGNEEVNYVEQAVEELLAGEDVSEPETFTYGCRVKYPRR